MISYTRTPASQPDLSLKRSMHAVVSAFAASAVVTWSAPVFGQAADSSSLALEEVVVTAQRRSENLQDVPVTVSALSGDDIAARGIESMADLGVVSPGLNVTNVVGNAILYLRGVGSNNSTAGNEQNVALYVDGVYYPSASAEPGSFKNIERIEVLKGPQGTLFGRNSTGGLIHVITKDPTQEFSGSASVGYGNYGTSTASTYLTGGITSVIAADISASYSHQDQGWGRNVTTGIEAYKGESLDLRSKWLFTPTDTTRLTLIAARTRLDTDIGASRQDLSLTPLPPSRNSQTRPADLYTTQTNVTPTYSVRQTTGSLKWEQELGALHLQTISAYQDTQRESILDLDNTAVAATEASFPNKTKSFSQEALLSPSDPGQLVWVVGAMYYWADGYEDPLAILAGPTRAPAALYNTGQKTNSLAGFGQATLALGSADHVTLGGRYTTDRQHLYGTLTTPAVTLTPTAPTNSATFNDFTYKVAYDHRFTDDVMAYVSVSTGFKSGVYNITFGSPAQTPVNPEKLTAYEIGMKSELAQRRVRLNVAAFYYDYKDLQLQSFTGTAIVTLNAAKAQIYGVEADLLAELTEHLRLQLGATALHSEYKDFPNLPSYDVSTGLGVPIAGLRGDGLKLQRTPNTTGTLNLTYEVPVSFGKLAASGTVYYTSKYFYEPDNRLEESAYALFNSELSWTSPNDRYKVSAWGKNLSAEKYYLTKTSGSGSPDTGAPAAPRTYGLGLNVKF